MANTFAERWIGTIRRELLKQPEGLPRTIIWNQQQHQNLVVDYIDHYNTHRPHRSLDQKPPRTDAPDQCRTTANPNKPNLTLHRLINKYRNAA